MFASDAARQAFITMYVVNSVFAVCVVAFAGYVVYGSDQRIRGLKHHMRIVRNLWLLNVITDIFTIAGGYMLIKNDLSPSNEVGLLVIEGFLSAAVPGLFQLA